MKVVATFVECNKKSFKSFILDDPDEEAQQCMIWCRLFS